jgi:hypothetical protein
MPPDSSPPATDTLDEILLDVATLIELSPQDRRITEQRYRRLKSHLERPDSPLAPYLVDGESLIYAQGSVAISTTIVSGTEDDRFDVDAAVEIDVPSHWPDSKALDLLERALQGFPGAKKIVRCTRCVQIQFATMHMDVTVVDRRERIPGERPGEIFHSPDDGRSYRVPANPWGFTAWFRSVVVPDQQDFAERLGRARLTQTQSRLDVLDFQERLAIAAAEQQDLPPVIPNRLDAQEAVALKLLKRFLNLRYEGLTLKRPPSIYLTKKTGDLGYIDRGLSVQLACLADYIAGDLRRHVAAGTRPCEVNPYYPPDEINDRWPRLDGGQNEDMETLADELDGLVKSLNTMAHAPLNEILRHVDILFGERVGQQQRKVLAQRYDRRDNETSVFAQPGSGQVFAPAVVTPKSDVREVPRHRFHPLVLKVRINGKGK